MTKKKKYSIRLTPNGRTLLFEFFWHRRLPNVSQSHVMQAIGCVFSSASYSFFFLPPASCGLRLLLPTRCSEVPAHQIRAPLLLVLPCPHSLRSVPRAPVPRCHRRPVPCSSLPFSSFGRGGEHTPPPLLSLTSCSRVLDSESNGKKNPLPLALLRFRHLNLWAPGWLAASRFVHRSAGVLFGLGNHFVGVFDSRWVFLVLVALLASDCEQRGRLLVVCHSVVSFRYPGFES